MEYTVRKEIHEYIFDLLFGNLDSDLNQAECNDIAEDIINMIEDKYDVTEK